MAASSRPATVIGRWNDISLCNGNNGCGGCGRMTGFLSSHGNYTVVRCGAPVRGSGPAVRSRSNDRNVIPQAPLGLSTPRPASRTCSPTRIPHPADSCRSSPSAGRGGPERSEEPSRDLATCPPDATIRVTGRERRSRGLVTRARQGLARSSTSWWGAAPSRLRRPPLVRGRPQLVEEAPTARSRHETSRRARPTRPCASLGRRPSARRSGACRRRSQPPQSRRVACGTSIAPAG